MSARVRVRPALVILALVAAACSSEVQVDERGTTTSPAAETETVSETATPPPEPGEPDGADRDRRTNALVTRVVDGDTIEVRFRGRELDVRLIGVDTPESVAPGVPVQCYALAASRYTTRQLEGERVRLGFDVERIDRYARTLAYVWLGRELFNETLVREGYAFVTTYPPNVRYVERFERAQREAREAERGVWRRCLDEETSPSCDPAYPSVCIPPPPPDLDCADVPERRFTVKPPDPHGFDGDHDGIGCET